MPKQLLNEAERFLLEHWADAHMLEESMEGVRVKYKEVFERIVDAVTKVHPELDINKIYLTQAWTDGQIGFGRSSWPTDKWGNPSGFWIWNLRLERLTAEESEQPCAAILCSLPKKTNIDLRAARVALSGAAKDLLSPEELKRTKSGDTVRLLYMPAPSKSELLRLLGDRDGDAFVKLFVSHFEIMARFVPVVDQLFRERLVTE